jgi:anti-sigma regulatory factor (Ser/Thr protein kinase)
LIAASNFALGLGFPKHECNSISTSVSELARNILKYAGSGEIVLEETDRRGVQVTAKDKGPGIEDVEAAMQDHYSSSGTLGLGLPGVRRMMDEFEIDTTPGEGTTVVVRKWHEPRTRRVRSIALTSALSGTGRRGATVEEDEKEASPGEPLAREGSIDCDYYIRPCRGERVSGDIALVERREGYLLAAIVDALGHGPNACRIAQQAASHLRESWSTDVVRTMRSLHAALRGTDGAAAGLFVLNTATQRARYTGVGNTVARVWGAQERQVFSTPGTLGHQIREPREQSLSLGAGCVLLLYTDGVKEQFDLDAYRQLRYEKARTIAATVVKRFGKDYDDASCLVLRYDS